MIPGLKKLYIDIKIVCFSIRWKIFNAYQRLRKKFIRGWYRGSVDENISHIKICYRDTIILAIMAADNKRNKVIVSFKPIQTDSEDMLAELKHLLQTQVSLLNNLFNRDMPISNRWEYARYHCGTTSNIYSKINTDVYWLYQEVKEK